MKRKYFALIVFGSLVIGVSLAGMQATQQGLTNWYPGLNKPPFQPPQAIFGIVWPILYAGIAYAGWLVWNARRSLQRTFALAAWALQLTFNLAWSELFFRFRRPDFALLDQVLLLLSIGAFMIAARRVSTRATLVFVPYLAWVAFATVLTIEIIRRNP